MGTAAAIVTGLRLPNGARYPAHTYTNAPVAAGELALLLLLATLWSQDRALSLRPDSAGMWSNRSFALQVMGRFDESFDASAKAVALDGQDPDSLNNHGVALQALGRAELIGETTGGGAHPTRGFPISPAVHIGIPFARSINPVTGTNWQGTGVVPDIAVPEAEAYDVAYARALRHVLARGDLVPPIEHEARDALAGLPATATTAAESAAARPAAADPAVTESPAPAQD